MRKRSIIAGLVIGLLVVFVCAGILWIIANRDSSAASSGTNAYMKKYTEEDVKEEGSVRYVDSTLLIVGKDGSSSKDIEKLVNKEGGQIVGCLPQTNDYQIEFDQGKNYKGLTKLVRKWNENDKVEQVKLQYVIDSTSASVAYTKDPWVDTSQESDHSGAQWDRLHADGKNWWAERIDMPSVWQHAFNFDPVKVGIYDTMFDVDQPDLSDCFEKTWNNPTDSNGNCQVAAYYEDTLDKPKKDQDQHLFSNDPSASYHGTHVAGIIASKGGNNYSISGVAQNAILYGYACKSEPGLEYVSTEFELKYALTLMFAEEVKIINLSQENTALSLAASKDHKDAAQALSLISDSLGAFLKKYLDAGHDFLLVKAAGNTGVDARYDIFGGITDQSLVDHILLVGAAENNNKHCNIAPYSNSGERVDLYAPGSNILSTFPGMSTGCLSGTSMAAPIVSGIAALAWGANTDLTAKQVKTVIKWASKQGMGKDNASSLGLFGQKQIPLANAYYTVLASLSTKGEKAEEGFSQGIIFGSVSTSSNGKDVDQLFCGQDVKVSREDGTATNIIKTDGSGNYVIFLDPGAYNLTVNCGSTYKECSYNARVDAGGLCLVDFSMEKNPMNPTGNQSSNQFTVPLPTQAATELVPETEAEKQKEVEKDKTVETIKDEANKKVVRNKTTDWKEAYKDYIDEHGTIKKNGNANDYCLVNIDDDDIPELLIYHHTVGQGIDICTFDGSTVEVLTVTTGVTFIPFQGLIRQYGYQIDAWNDIFYLENGEFHYLGGGTYDGDAYYWEEMPVSEEEYWENLDNLYDESIEESSNDYPVYTGDAIYDGIEDY